MAGIKTYLNRRLTCWETVIVIAAVATIGVGGYLSYKLISATILDAKINAALPKVCDALREQRQKIVGAIENYRAEFGFYPPDHIVSRQPLVVNAYTNPLLYELVGAVVNPTNQMLELPRLEEAEIGFVKQFFHSTGFVNSGSSTGAVQHFVSLETFSARQLHDDPDVFALGFQIYSLDVPSDIAWQFIVGPWQYVSTFPDHNPQKFDLWIEVKTKTRSVVVGNWRGVE
jgi:hypothetical protein